MLKLTLIALMCLMLVACRSAPIQNVEHEPVRINKINYTIEDVERGIIRGGVSMGWEMYRKQPGLIEGTLYIGKHVVEVTIPYNMQSYNISYRNSKNMNYDSGKIHKSYNRWIDNLNKAIRQSLSSEM